MTVLQEKRRDIFRKQGSTSPKTLNFGKKFFDMLYDAVESITQSYSDEWSYSKKASLFILFRLLMSSKASLDLLIRGYFYDYTVVERSIWESMALISLFSKDEESAKEWFAFKRLDIPKWKLVHHLWVGTPTKKVTARINEAYASQSRYIHSTFFAIISEFLNNLSRKKRSFYFPRFQKSLIADTISTPPILLVFTSFIDLYHKELKKDFKSRFLDLMAEKITDWEARGLFKKEDLE